MNTRQKIDYVRLALTNAADVRTQQGDKRAAETFGALADILGEALNELSDLAASAPRSESGQ